MAGDRRTIYPAPTVEAAEPAGEFNVCESHRSPASATRSAAGGSCGSGRGRPWPSAPDRPRWPRAGPAGQRRARRPCLPAAKNRSARGGDAASKQVVDDQLRLPGLGEGEGDDGGGVEGIGVAGAQVAVQGPSGLVPGDGSRAAHDLGCAMYVHRLDDGGGLTRWQGWLPRGGCRQRQGARYTACVCHVACRPAPSRGLRPGRRSNTPPPVDAPARPWRNRATTSVTVEINDGDTSTWSVTGVLESVGPPPVG